MPFLTFSNIDLQGSLTVEALVSGPEYILSEQNGVTNTGKGFGFSMDAESTTALIGAYSAAKAFIYEYNGVAWTQKAVFSGTNRFGFKVSVSGEWAAVSDSPVSGNGSAFIFRKVSGVWGTTPHTTITTPSAALGSGFGASVSLDNGTLVIGHTLANTIGGAHVYIWNGSAWTKQGGLLTTASGNVRSSSQNLGIDVSIDGDLVVIGGSGDTVGKGLGVALVSKRTGSTWSNPVLIKPETTYADGFGWSVRAKGSKVLIGAPNGNTTAVIPGRAFLYDVSGATPTLEQIFTVKADKSEIVQDTIVATTDTFGWSVELTSSMGQVAIGSIGRNGNRGAVYVFEKIGTKWSQSATPNGSKIIPTAITANARFGSSIVFTNDGLLVGAYGNTTLYWFK